MDQASIQPGEIFPWTIQQAAVHAKTMLVLMADQRYHAKVAAGGRLGTGLADQRVEAGLPQVLPEHFQAGIGRECHVPKFQAEIPIDTGGQIGFSSSHDQRPFVRVRKRWVTPPSTPDGRPLSIAIPAIVAPDHARRILTGMTHQG